MKIFLFLMTLACCLTAQAEPNRPNANDPVAQHLFPPELIMRHRQQLGLSEAQGKQVVSLIQEFQSRMVPIEWEMASARETLLGELGNHPVDEKAALAALSQILEREGQVKRNHISLLVRLKNVLTPEQAQTLNRLR